MEQQLQQRKPSERLDDLQNGYFILQDPARFCFGLDAVLLADFAGLRKGERVLDLGTGTGILPILMAAREPSATFTALEIQKECADMAGRSVAYNGLSSRIRVMQGDLREAAALFGAASFRVVTCNPPYMRAEDGRENPEESLRIARHEVLCTLEDVISQTSKVLVSSGRFYLVHRPFRLPEIFGELRRCHLEPKRLRLVHPYVDREPKLVLIEAVKGGKPRLTVEPPLIVFGEDGSYTPEVTRIYGGGKG